MDDDVARPIRSKEGAHATQDQSACAPERGTGGAGDGLHLCSNVLVAPDMTWLALPALAGSCVYLRSKANRQALNKALSAKPDEFDTTLPGRLAFIVVCRITVPGVTRHLRALTSE